MLLLLDGQFDQLLLVGETAQPDSVQPWEDAENTHPTQHPSHLYSVQDGFDDTGDDCQVVLVLQVDAIQHHLVGPADEVGKTLIHPIMAGRQRRTVVALGNKGRGGI